MKTFITIIFATLIGIYACQAMEKEIQFSPHIQRRTHSCMPQDPSIVLVSIHATLNKAVQNFEKIISTSKGLSELEVQKIKEESNFLSSVIKVSQDETYTFVNQEACQNAGFKQFPLQDLIVQMTKLGFSLQPYVREEKIAEEYLNSHRSILAQLAKIDAALNNKSQEISNTKTPRKKSFRLRNK